MGYSQRAAILTVKEDKPTLYYNAITFSRSLIFEYSLYNNFNLLAFENKFGGTIKDCILFKKHTLLLKRKMLSYSKVNLEKRIVRINIPFAVSLDEEFFVNKIYRESQEKLYTRLYHKANKAMEKLTEESVLICLSGISDYVDLYK